MTQEVFEPFTLPSGGILKNRIVKATMEENITNVEQLPDAALFNLHSN